MTALCHVLRDISYSSVIHDTTILRVLDVSLIHVTYDIVVSQLCDVCIPVSIVNEHHTGITGMTGLTRSP